MKLFLILSLFLLGTVSSFHLKNEDLRIDTPEKQETLNQEQEISDEEESLASGEDESWWEKEEASELVPVPATKEDDNVCPKEEDIVHLTGTPECQGCRFLLIRQPRTFRNAQSVCQRCYRGRLVSIHNYNSNYLIYKASCGINQGQVWIGGHVTGWGPCKRFFWLDGSRWNFAYWASGQPGNGGGNCVALCTRGGHWRRAPCVRRLPFICSY
ncbi:bone marrow proteoglycan-like [Trichosurus vulpecula]|uniref:bone marrow proteoglycan-like n=1 Tax=Trichosurus vulpecula TaxID=9337 RepID=UPI00186ADA3E|nr:bone marrow proteoglycan-like [Trichosurus vulpecula]